MADRFLFVGRSFAGLALFSMWAQDAKISARQHLSHLAVVAEFATLAVFLQPVSKFLPKSLQTLKQKFFVVEPTYFNRRIRRRLG